MIYLLYGENSYRALEKIADIKSAFYKKGKKNIAVAEIDGQNLSLESILEFIGSGNLFASQRLVVFKQTLEIYPQLADIIKDRGTELSKSMDIFIFWERNFLNNDEVLSIFKKITDNIKEMNPRSREELDRWLQEEAITKGASLTLAQRRLMLEKQLILGVESSEWALQQELEKFILGEAPNIASTYKQNAPTKNLIFSFVDRIFDNKFLRGFIAFRQAKDNNIDETDLVRMCLWKLKNIFIVRRGESKKLNPYVAQKTAIDAKAFDDKGVLDAFWGGILTDSALKRDNKNSDEHIESYLLSMKNKIR